MRLHHAQLSMPRGEESEARRFYGEALGLQEVSKPQALAGRGGCWFRANGQGVMAAEIHLGVEDPFAPAQKAHPGLLCGSVIELEALASRIESLGYQLSWTERETFEGYLRCHVRDGFGNRIELMAAFRDTGVNREKRLGATASTEHSQLAAHRDHPMPGEVSRLLATVPEWFGQPAANAEYIEAARHKET